MAQFTVAQLDSFPCVMRFWTVSLRGLGDFAYSRRPYIFTRTVH